MNDINQMNPMSVLIFDSVSLTMSRTKRRSGSGRSKRLRRFAGETKRSIIPVLNSVSFEVHKGEAVALIGGRSLLRTSLLRLAAGTLMPDAGTVTRSEPIVPMIGIARAFGRGYTIRQNIYLVGGLLGLTAPEVEARIPEIVDFADLKNTLDKHLGAAPPSTRQKVAWSIAMSLDARFYAIDQTLVVGERDFRQKCWTHVDQLREQGATFIVSADNSKVYRRFCDRALYFSQGGLESDTTVADALAQARKARNAARELDD
jgi:ABC-type polysaccharide/polyol phosphate transport system ATPase subunit